MDAMDLIWARCRELLRTKVTDHMFATWLDPIVCEEVSEDTITLSVPNAFFIDWIKEKHLSTIRESIREVAGKRYEMSFRSRDDFATGTEEASPSKEEPQEKAGYPPAMEITAEVALRRNLSPRYTFESFVVGSCNQFPHAAARAVSENLGGSYNPLFIYGGVGLGKTHLMSAIGYSALSRDKSKKVYFTTSEEFMNELIHSIQFDKTVEFREKYRSVDLLMIDDIQFLSGKEATQEEFFHTFNSLYESRSQLVITCDRFPNEISGIEQRLRTRFSWGLIADMGIPDIETRVAILKRKAFEDSIRIPDDVAYFLAEHVSSNVRELVGYWTRVVAMSVLQGIPLSVDLARGALREILQQHRKNITIDTIISAVSKAFNVKALDVRSKKRHKQYSLPRQVGMYLARELTELSFPEIGTAFGGKDHSTVIHAVKKIEKLLEQDHSLKNTVEGLRREIRGG